jgi:hypothetical protein
MVITLFDAEGVGKDGTPYRNTYTWYFQMRDGAASASSTIFGRGSHRRADMNPAAPSHSGRRVHLSIFPQGADQMTDTVTEQTDRFARHSTLQPYRTVEGTLPV